MSEPGLPADLRPRREPVFNIPAVVVGLLALFFAIHAYRVWFLTDAQDANLLARFAFVPARLTFLYDPHGVARALASLPAAQGIQVSELMTLIAGTSSEPWTVLTYAFLHGGWEHIIANSIWFVAFGAPVARRIGTTRFLLLFAVTAIAGAAFHYVFFRYDVEPVVGASAAVSGIMAYAARFVFQPGAPLGSALGFKARGSLAAYLQPALPLRRLFTDGRVLAFLAIWLVVNFVFGVAAQPLGITDAPVAWQAHIGGFLAGLLLFRFFDPKPVPPPISPESEAAS